MSYGFVFCLPNQFIFLKFVFARSICYAQGAASPCPCSPNPFLSTAASAVPLSSSAKVFASPLSSAQEVPIASISCQAASSLAGNRLRMSLTMSILSMKEKSLFTRFLVNMRKFVISMTTGIIGSMTLLGNVPRRARFRCQNVLG
jgi:hypothetical protein